MTTVNLQLLPILRKTAVALMLVAALAAVHFLGFLRSMPEGIQRLVASSFALEFSATFIYYLALAMLGARMGTYAFAAVWSLRKLWWQRLRAKRSWPSMLSYMRGAKSTYSILDWPVFVLAPVLLAVLYADIRETLIMLGGVAVALVLLAPIAAPQATLAPKRSAQRLLTDFSLKRMRANINLIVLVAVVLVTLSYFFGKARYSRLAAAPTSTIQSSAYIGEAVVLAQSGSTTLALERSKTSSHIRFVLFREGFLVAETIPPGSHQFEPIRGK